MPNLGPTELIIIAVVILLLFGYKKLPDAARSVGRSMRVFKAETKGMKDDDAKGTAAPAATADYTQTPVNQPAALPAQPASVEQQRGEAQRFLDTTAHPAVAEPPTTQR